MADKTKNAPKAPTPPEPDEQNPAVPYNPASDPNLSAEERLEALAKQQAAMQKNPTGEYPL